MGKRKKTAYDSDDEEEKPQGIIKKNEPTTSQSALSLPNPNYKYKNWWDTPTESAQPAKNHNFLYGGTHHPPTSTLFVCKINTNA